MRASPRRSNFSTEMSEVITEERTRDIARRTRHLKTAAELVLATVFVPILFMIVFWRDPMQARSSLNETRIRTHGGLHLNGLQDERTGPLRKLWRSPCLERQLAVSGTPDRTPYLRRSATLIFV